jgi:hypothetical protein
MRARSHRPCKPRPSRARSISSKTPFRFTSRFSFGSGNVDDSLAHNVLNVLDSVKRYRDREFMDLLRLDNGEPLVKGKNVTGFSWPEEVAAQRADAVPFSLQDALERRGCKYSCA